MKFKIFAALREDINNGHVWIRMEDQNHPARSVIQIKHPGIKKTFYWEAISIKENFLKYYNQSGRIPIKENENPIVINEWYRTKLGILVTQSEEYLDIKIAGGWRGKIRACLQHPQVIVRVATYLGIISVILGVLSILLAIDIPNLLFWILCRISGC